MEERAEDDDGPRGIRVRPDREPPGEAAEGRMIAQLVVAISVGAFLLAAVVTVLGALAVEP